MKPNVARVCPEPVYTDPSGTPRSVATRQIRWCFPGDAQCLCDRDGDCYALGAYTACVAAPAEDAATDVAPMGSPLCPEAVYRDASGTPRSVSTRQIRWCFPGEARCFCDRDNDCYAEQGYVPCTPPPTVADSGAPDVAANVCPEAVYRDASGTPRSVTTRQIRWCFPGEARCFCDSDNDCYTLSGYVACVAPVADAGADAAADVAVVDAPRDVAMDAAPDVAATPDAPLAGVCSEAVYLDSRGTPRSVTTRQVRWCFPGEARCLCDSDGDCYALTGYVPCAPPGTTPDASVDAAPDAALDAAPDIAPDVAPDVTVDAAPDVALDVGAGSIGPTGAPPPDTIAYGGSFNGATGLSRATLTVGGVARTAWVYAPRDRSARPPLLVTLHDVEETGDTVLEGSGARRLADLRGVVVVSPDARREGPDWYDPSRAGVRWDTTRASPDANADLLLLRALVAESVRRYAVDPERVYVMGHGSGGFLAVLASVSLAERVAAIATSGAGVVPCATRPACGFTGIALSCGALASEPGWCACSGASLPAEPTAARGAPAYLAHGVEDTTVSPRYTCALAARLASLGAPAVTVLRAGGHYLPSHFATDAWAFLAAYRRR